MSDTLGLGEPLHNPSNAALEYVCFSNFPSYSPFSSDVSEAKCRRQEYPGSTTLTVW